MERLILRMLFVSCMASIPFVLKRKNVFMALIVFFAKGVLLTAIDSVCIKSKRISYPVRPFSKYFETNVLFDLLFFPILSVIWVKMSYNTKPLKTILFSLCCSVPMSITQWALEKKTKLFKWHNWTILHTFVSINFTLFTIRGFAGLIRKLYGDKSTAFRDAQLNIRKLRSRREVIFTPESSLEYPSSFEYEPMDQAELVRTYN